MMDLRRFMSMMAFGAETALCFDQQLAAAFEFSFHALCIFHIAPGAIAVGIGLGIEHQHDLAVCGSV